MAVEGGRCEYKVQTLGESTFMLFLPRFLPIFVVKNPSEVWTVHCKTVKIGIAHNLATPPRRRPHDVREYDPRLWGRTGRTHRCP